MNDDKTKSILLVKKSDSKKGSLWHILANKRIIKQHGGFDIPEDDLHAIPQYHSPVEKTPDAAEDTNETLTDIEKEIQQLKKHDDITQQARASLDNGEKQYED